MKSIARIVAVTGEESSARRRGDPERGLALHFSCFRNPFGVEREERKTTVIQ